MALAVMEFLVFVESVWLSGREPPEWSAAFPNWDCRDTIYDEFRESQHVIFDSWLQEEINPTVCPLGWTYQRLLHKDFKNVDAPPLFVLLGTDWPILELLSSYALDDNENNIAAQESDLNCWNITEPINFSRFRVELWDAEWFTKGMKYVFNDMFTTADGWGHVYSTCPFGAIAQQVWHIYIVSQAHPVGLETHLRVFETSGIKVFGLKKLTLGHNWPLMPLLNLVKKRARRHGFWLDFSPAEMAGTGYTEMSGPREDESVIVGSVYADVARVVSAGKVLTFLHKKAARSLVYLTMIFGNYNKHLEKYMRRAEALGVYYLIIYCLDDEAWEICRRVDEDRCIRGRKRSMLNKFALPLVFLSMGVDVFYLDVDTFWVKNPTPYLLERLKETNTEMLVSASFADDCICSGIIFWGATQTVRTWLFWLLSWMYEHFHVDDQQILSAFLHHGDVENLTRPEVMSNDINFQKHFLPKLPQPRWAILDPVVQFAHAWSLNTTGWTGDINDMVIFHFLGGGNEFNAESSAANWSSKYGESAASNRSLGDIFYGEPLDFYMNSHSTLTDSIRSEVYRSWRAARPKEMLHCGEVLGAREPFSEEVWVIPSLEPST